MSMIIITESPLALFSTVFRLFFESLLVWSLPLFFSGRIGKRFPDREDEAGTPQPHLVMTNYALEAHSREL